MDVQAIPWILGVLNESEGPVSRTIVTTPCVGEFTRTISDTGLCVTTATRSDPGLYAQALLSFRR